MPQCITPIPVKGSIVPCGKCNFCLQRKRADWSFRLYHEERLSISSYFITLTYSEENLPECGLKKSDLQRYFKRLRKTQKRKLRYYAVGEYGSITQRAHYHILLFNLEDSATIQTHWPLGLTYTGTVEEASIHYVTKYMINRVPFLQRSSPPFTLMSKGIGKGYLTPAKMEYHRQGLPYCKKDGFKLAMPRYYKEKLFTKQEIHDFGKIALADAKKRYEETLSLLGGQMSETFGKYLEALKNEEYSIFSKINENSTL